MSSPYPGDVSVYDYQLSLRNRCSFVPLLPGNNLFVFFNRFSFLVAQIRDIKPPFMFLSVFILAFSHFLCSIQFSANQKYLRQFQKDCKTAPGTSGVSVDETKSRCEETSFCSKETPCPTFFTVRFLTKQNILRINSSFVASFSSFQLLLPNFTGKNGTFKRKNVSLKYSNDWKYFYYQRKCYELVLKQYSLPTEYVNTKIVK